MHLFLISTTCIFVFYLFSVVYKYSVKLNCCYVNVKLIKIADVCNIHIINTFVICIICYYNIHYLDFEIILNVMIFKKYARFRKTNQEFSNIGIIYRKKCCVPLKLNTSHIFNDPTETQRERCILHPQIMFDNKVFEFWSILVQFNITFSSVLVQI